METGLIRDFRTVVGEILVADGITLPNATLYIDGGTVKLVRKSEYDGTEYKTTTGLDFIAEQLMANGLGPFGRMQRVEAECALSKSSLMMHGGPMDSRTEGRGLTNITEVLDVRPSYGNIDQGYCTYNPWNLIMEGVGEISYVGLREIDRNVHRLRINPRKYVEKIRDLYSLFSELPRDIQGEFLNLVNSYPADISNYSSETYPSYDLQINKIIRELGDKKLMKLMGDWSRIYSEIEKSEIRHSPVTQEDFLKIRYVLHLIAHDNIRFNKKELVESQLDSLLGFDTEGIGTKWTLRERISPEVITQARLEELTGMLRNYRRKD
ncbi:MAG TPA: hypothetical protein VI564_06490 [Candidatus Nanoarchaeia archaeon]|nr:hypothetical protein [Candidatus Nanoarchaeia archaeon]